MKRILKFTVWLASGIIGTLVIPAFFFAVAALAPKTKMGHYSAALCGFSFYSVVPIGFLLSLFVAFASLRRTKEKTIYAETALKTLLPNEKKA